MCSDEIFNLSLDCPYLSNKILNIWDISDTELNCWASCFGKCSKTRITFNNLQLFLRNDQKLPFSLINNYFHTLLLSLIDYFDNHRWTCCILFIENPFEMCYRIPFLINKRFVWCSQWLVSSRVVIWPFLLNLSFYPIIKSREFVLAFVKYIFPL